MRKLLIAVIPFLLLSTGFQDPIFEEKDTSSMIKASYIYNFAKLIDWPQDQKSGTFVISVMGGQNVYAELTKKYRDKKVGSQQIEIRKIPKTLNFSPCQVLVVSKENADLLPELSKTLKGKPTLLVSDDPGSLSKGAVINFVVEDHNLKFELSVSNANAHKLFVGSTLKSLALYVEN
jgi:hypothetical protein